jgi:hypothetical protein
MGYFIVRNFVIYTGHRYYYSTEIKEARMRRRGMHTEFWWGNLFGHDYLEEREADERTTLSSILIKQAVSLGSGWNWIRIVFSGGL